MALARRTVWCKVGTLAGEGVSDGAEGLAALAQLAHIPHAHAVVAAGGCHQPLFHRLDLQSELEALCQIRHTVHGCMQAVVPAAFDISVTADSPSKECATL